MLSSAREGAWARAQASEEEQSRLLSTVAHELRTPLTAIIGFSQTLLDGRIKDPKLALEQISLAGKSMNELISDLLALQKAREGRFHVEHVRTELWPLLEGQVELYRGQSELHRLELVGEPLAVSGDEERLEQIVGNLLSNAIKYTATGSITLRARSYAGDHPADASHVFVEVEDTGPGIPVEKHEIIFEEFARLAGGSHSGAGLGLAISKHVADALGCRLELRSDVGRGSTFALCIPVRAQIAGPSRTDAAGSAEPSTHARSTSEATEVRSA
jgi:signal transduction histidine kinase